jgi:hypothetical protein
VLFGKGLQKERAIFLCCDVCIFHSEVSSLFFAFLFFLLGFDVYMYILLVVRRYTLMERVVRFMRYVCLLGMEMRLMDFSKEVVMPSARRDGFKTGVNIVGFDRLVTVQRLWSSSCSNNGLNGVR